MRPRVVLITGTSSRRGIGYATARRLANRGHTVYATMRSLDTAADLAADTGPGRIEVRHLDLLDRSAMRPLLDIARTSFETNVWGTKALAQEALPVMRGQGHGHRLNACGVIARRRAAALANLVAADDPALAEQSGPGSHAYAAGAVRDPSRSAEFAALLAGVKTG
ncbi:MAG TPA: SDR family NAD(P)-dependent oxidoreductase [Mycobacterium sp.]|nr:SDR family NAD(P)-dependent oxidoreductase [Mycobacterium sp.]